MELHEHAEQRKHHPAQKPSFDHKAEITSNPETQNTNPLPRGLKRAAYSANGGQVSDLLSHGIRVLGCEIVMFWVAGLGVRSLGIGAQVLHANLGKDILWKKTARSEKEAGQWNAGFAGSLVKKKLQAVGALSTYLHISLFQPDHCSSTGCAANTGKM